MTAGALAQLVDTPAFTHRTRDTQNGIDSKANDDTDKNLHPKNSRDGFEGNRLGNENGQHLVGSGKENGDECTKRDHASRIERRCSGRETALGNDPENRADRGADSAALLDSFLEFARGTMLEPFHGNVGYQQERDKVQRVKRRIEQYVKKHLQLQNLFRRTVLTSVQTYEQSFKPS